MLDLYSFRQYYDLGFYNQIAVNLGHSQSGLTYADIGTR